MSPNLPGSPNGKLSAAMLSSAMAARTDPARFGRGKSYVRDGSVTAVTVGGGELTGSVQGSRRQPYDVTVRVPTLGAKAFEMLEQGAKGLNELVPSARELRCSCTCPDGVVTCKHAVAVVLAFADQVAINPRLLLAWRGGGAAEGVPERDDGSWDVPVTRPGELRGGRLATVHPIRPGISRPSSTPAPPVPELAPAVRDFLGLDLPEPSGSLPELGELRLPGVAIGDIDLGQIVDEALSELHAALHR